MRNGFYRQAASLPCYEQGVAFLLIASLPGHSLAVNPADDCIEFLVGYLPVFAFPAFHQWRDLCVLDAVVVEQGAKVEAELMIPPGLPSFGRCQLLVVFRVEMPVPLVEPAGFDVNLDRVFGLLDYPFDCVHQFREGLCAIVDEKTSRLGVYYSEAAGFNVGVDAYDELGLDAGFHSASGILSSE